MQAKWIKLDLTIIDKIIALARSKLRQRTSIKFIIFFNVAYPYHLHNFFSNMPNLALFQKEKNSQTLLLSKCVNELKLTLKQIFNLIIN